MKEMEGGRGRGCCCFCDGDGNGYADNDCNGNMMGTINYHLLLESNRIIVVVIYFLFIFNENARENLWATKGMGGGRVIVG